MHESVLQFFERALPRRQVHGQRVLEVGSLNVNGSVRTILEPHGPIEYVGIDMTPGPGVDLVTTVEDFEKPPDRATTWERKTFGVVVSTEMLEHAPDWRSAVEAMTRLCSGVLVVTARGPGFPKHDYPNDHWRFTLEDFHMMFSKDFDIVALMPDPNQFAPGVFLKAHKKGGTSWIGPERVPE